jgi:cytochrome b subunit of formate dehydrogenase
MRTLLPLLVLSAVPLVGMSDQRALAVPAAKAAATTVAAPALPPKTGSHISPDDNLCVQCHQEQDTKDPATRRLHVDRTALAEDVHWKHGVDCSDCHGGDPKADQVNQAHAKENGFRGAGEAARKMCAYCHADQALALVKSVHATAGEKDQSGRGTILGCLKCHGANQHHILPVTDKRSPVFVNNQVQTCGGCHQEWLASYGQSVHGLGLFKMGLLVTATCANCHGAHGIYRAADQRSTLFLGNVAATCGKCHRFIAERLNASIHGPPGQPAKAPPAGERLRQHLLWNPSCTSCHRGHQIVMPESGLFHRGLSGVCGNCHGELSSSYASTIHGELTSLGYQPAASCNNCHGSHEILAVTNPASLVSPENRLTTCRKCHPQATANFAAFDPHVSYEDPRSNPVVYWVYRVLLTLLLTTFGVFGLHSAFWWMRGLVEVSHEGRPKGLVPGKTAYVRFAPMHRRGHAILMTSFLGLALTGLPLKYSQTAWAKLLAASLGGFESTSFWHRVFALITFGCFGFYVVRMARQFLAGRRQGMGWLRVVFGPDSPVPNWRDVKDFLKMVRWFVGLGPKPTFERWAYWEKFDFWGACADIVIIGSTGLVLWFPNFFCLFLPGVTLNVAKVIHSTQALLATGFVFAIHFFGVHLRAEKFPADMSLLTGLVSEEELLHERPEYFQRLQREGLLEQLRTTAPSKWRIRLLKLAGFAALSVGLALLWGMVYASFSG